MEASLLHGARPLLLARRAWSDAAAWSGHRAELVQLPAARAAPRLRNGRPVVLCEANGGDVREDAAGGVLLARVNGQGNGAMLATAGASAAERKRGGTSPMTGGSVDVSGATAPLIMGPLAHEKKIVMVRHGLSSWNEEGRVQGASDKSILSEKGKAQAYKCKEALSHMDFDKCFASPISRARVSYVLTGTSTAELIWEGREEPLVFLDNLREAHLHVLEGMKNEEANELYPELYGNWRGDPLNFCVGGVYPVVDLYKKARDAWVDILREDGDQVLVVTHKSILRAMLGIALGLGPDKFRAVDINNGGISVFKINKKGEPMLQALNLTSHLHNEAIFY
eukprot:SM000070S21346  [mRNA]  locus=s70:632946:635434:+ [translate_table: standard]